jgi:release factor glutamine methyltransferase
LFFIKKMTIQDVKIGFRSRLNKRYETKEIQSLCSIFLEHIGITKHDAIISPTYILSPNQTETYEQCIARLENDEPIQYILGSAYFYGLLFAVNQSVLIPRQETEQLVETIINRYKNETCTIIDLCTGSGCIAISLAKLLPKAQVIAVDISADAIDIAKQNARTHGVNIDFITHDILDFGMHSKLPNAHVIVSNPPYVRQSDKEHMHKNVLAYEPEIALFVPNENALLFYKALAQISMKRLQTNGFIMCEINEALGPETKQLFVDSGFTDCTIIYDIHEKQRFITAKK